MKGRCADLRLEGFELLAEPCFETCTSDFKSNSARERDYHMKPMRPILYVLIHTARYTVERCSVGQVRQATYRAYQFSHSPAPLNIERG